MSADGDVAPRDAPLIDVGVALALWVGAFALLLRAARALGLLEGEAVAVSRWLATPGARLHVADRLTDARLPVVATSALLPVAAYALLRSDFSRPIAALGAALAILAPRATIELVARGGDGPVAAWLAVAMTLHLASRPGASPWLGALAAAAVGAAASWSLVALWALPVMALEHLMTTWADARRQLSSGRASLPASVALAPVVGVVVYVALDRALWAHPFDRARELLVAAGAPEIARGVWRGEAPMPDTIPRGHAAASLLLALPSATSVLAIVGALSATRIKRRALTSSLIAIVVLIGHPLIVPPMLGRFPGRYALALPFVAVAATWGAVLLGRAASRWLGATWPPLALTCALALAPFVAPPASLSACFPALMGGAARAKRGAIVPFSDGTESGGLLGAIDALGLGDAAVFAPTIPAESWEAYRRFGRLRTRVHAVGSLPRARISIDDGSLSLGRTRATLRRDGQIVAVLRTHGAAP